MSFQWLKSFQQNMEKPENYAEKTLAAYRLGMRANGSIAGIIIIADPEGCAACRRLDSGIIHHPDEAPHLPLADCDQPQSCGCVYRPIMTYQVDDQE